MKHQQRILTMEHSEDAVIFSSPVFERPGANFPFILALSLQRRPNDLVLSPHDRGEYW